MAEEGGRYRRPLLDIHILAPFVKGPPRAVLKPRIGRVRPFRCWWSRSIRCRTRLPDLGLAVREILGEVGFPELMQRGAHSGVFDLETREVERELHVAAAACVVGAVVADRCHILPNLRVASVK